MVNSFLKLWLYYHRDGRESLELDLRCERAQAAYLDSARQQFWMCPWTLEVDGLMAFSVA